jgi:hypothetical protein
MLSGSFAGWSAGGALDVGHIHQATIASMANKATPAHKRDRYIIGRPYEAKLTIA